MSIAPLDKSQRGTILRGVQTWKLGPSDFFDRIINIKFIRANGGDFSLRSDYEVAFDTDKKPHFRTIRQKPQILINYKQVANGTAIQVDVRITNLYMLKTTTGDSIYMAGDNPITQLVIQMGYRKQFPDWARDPVLRADNGDGKNRLEDFYEMNPFTITNVPEYLQNGLQITAEVLAIYPEGNPPDQVTYFKCIVGTMNFGLLWQQPGLLKEYFTNTQAFPGGREERLSPIEKTLFLYITSRFLSSAFQYRLSDSRYQPGYVEGDEIVQTLMVKGYNTGSHTRYPPDDPKSKEWTTIEFVNGVLKPEDAAALGVGFVVSRRLRQKSNEDTTYRSAPTEDAYLPGLEDEKIPAVGFQAREGAQLIKIQEAYPSMRWYKRNDGSYLVYDVEESIGEITSDEWTSASLDTALPVVLPAVYDITAGGTRYIRCPFCTYLSMGQLIGFRSKYNIGTMVGYFYPLAEDAWYETILADIQFSTTGDENEMKIMCVDVSKEEAERRIEAVGTAGNPKPESEAAITQTNQTINRSLEWVTRQIVEDFSADADTRKGETVASNWETLAVAYVLNNAHVPELSGAKDLGAAVALLAGENTDLSNGNMDTYGKDPIGDLYGLTLGPLQTGDTVNVPRAKSEVA